MSNSRKSKSGTSSQQRYTLRLPADADAVTIYDARDSVVWAGAGRGAIDLPRGLYTVRVESNQEIAERAVRLVGSHDLTQLAPRRYTAAPLKDTAMSHEYYSHTSQDLSRKETRAPLSTGPVDAGLFVFLRALDQEHASRLTRAVGQGLELRNPDGSVASRFEPQECEVDSSRGYLAFSAQAPHGSYRLADIGDQPREMALHLFPHWQTQVFVLWTDRAVLEASRVFVQRPGSGFRFEAEAEQAADLALDALATGGCRVPKRALNVLWGEKFANPVLGLIGAYTEMERLRRLSGTERRAAAGEARNLLEMVIGNLGALVPESPDVHALEVFAAEVFGRQMPPRQFTQPPMFRSGFDAVVRAAAERPELVPEIGIVDDIATVLFTDSVWTTWRPLTAPPRRLERTSTTFAVSRHTVPAGGAAQKIGTIGMPMAQSPAKANLPEFECGDDSDAAARLPAWQNTGLTQEFEPDWIQSGFLTALQAEQTRLRRTRQTGEPRVTTTGLAARLRVTPRAIEKAVAELDAIPADQLGMLLETGWEELASTIDPSQPRPFSRFLEGEAAPLTVI